MDSPRQVTRSIPLEDDLGFIEAGSTMSVLTGAVKEYLVAYDDDDNLSSIIYKNAAGEVLSAIDITTSATGKITRVRRRD